MPIKTYTFGLLSPTYNGCVVDEQMFLAHRYRNMLTEIERQRLDSVRAALAAHVDVAAIDAEIAPLADELEAGRLAIKRTRSATRSRSETAEQRARVRELSGMLKELRAKRKAARTAISDDPEVRAKIEEADNISRERVRQARKTCGVYWGTYLLQEADADRARQSHMQPKFRKWTGDGRVSVQLQGGLTIEDLMSGEDTRLRIGGHQVYQGPAPRPFSWDVCRAKRLHLRIGSDDKQRPIWAEWPLILSREIPPGSVIKVATVSRYRDGTQVPHGDPRSIHDSARWRWTLHLTIELPESAARPSPASGVVAVNLGFCMRPGGIRSGYVVGDDGHEEEILVPTRDIESLGKADHIRSIRDLAMDDMRARLCAWLTEPGRVLPEWMTGTGEAPGMTATIHAWRSPDRFRFLALRWRHRRFEADEAGYDIIEAWRHRDLHLDQYEHGLRTTALRRRRERYRIIAARLSSRYRTLIVDESDLTHHHKSPLPEEGTHELSTVKQQVRIAAGSELRAVFQNAFSGRFEKHGDAWMTRRCSVCGEIDHAWERSDNSRDHTCLACHTVWDQDANFCRNLIRERSCSDSGTGTARSGNHSKPKLTRQQRLRSKPTKQEDSEIARN